MALEKSKIDESLKNFHKAQIAELEERIDNHLKSNYYLGGSVTYDVKGFNLFVIEAIRDKYKQAGWTVKENKGDDQREGSWHQLIFS